MEEYKPPTDEELKEVWRAGYTPGFLSQVAEDLLSFGLKLEDVGKARNLIKLEQDGEQLRQEMINFYTKAYGKDQDGNDVQPDLAEAQKIAEKIKLILEN